MGSMPMGSRHGAPRHQARQPILLDSAGKACIRDFGLAKKQPGHRPDQRVGRPKSSECGSSKIEIDGTPTFGSRFGAADRAIPKLADERVSARRRGFDGLLEQFLAADATVA